MLKLCMGSCPNPRILRLKGICILKPQPKITALFDPKFETPSEAECQKIAIFEAIKVQNEVTTPKSVSNVFLSPIQRTFSDIRIIAARPPTSYLFLGGKAIFDLLKIHQIGHSDCGSKVGQKKLKIDFLYFFLKF